MIGDNPKTTQNATVAIIGKESLDKKGTFKD